jgi:hypothetical protein
MHDTSQLTKRSITYVLIALLVLAAVYAIHASRVLDTFDKNHLIRTAFQADLTPYIDGEETAYSDGCLQFHDIDETHPLYIRYFSQPYEMTFQISFVHEKLSTNKGRDNIRFQRFADESDGYVPVVAYDPELQTLMFGYSNSIGG